MSNGVESSICSAERFAGFQIAESAPSSNDWSSSPLKGTDIVPAVVLITFIIIFSLRRAFAG